MVETCYFSILSPLGIESSLLAHPHLSVTCPGCLDSAESDLSFWVCV